MAVAQVMGDTDTGMYVPEGLPALSPGAGIDRAPPQRLSSVPSYDLFRSGVLLRLPLLLLILFEKLLMLRLP